MKALTKHRELILQDLKVRHDHPTAKMVFESVRDKADKISFATVYNSLEYLVGHKLVNKLNIESESVRYDAFLDDHSHLICHSCGTILDVPALKLDESTDWKAMGFVADHIDIVVSGTCSSCKSH
ncbi:Fur family transcriptional regulator [Leptospira levettii]|uniref:Transcriptional repressor n=1 Tax=Leptospira levettii TaxID=2023178 RepID=A0ABY2MJT6_9LEPT|nr:transcriptional repressor [Leptospira levettii]TGL66498.1 transcriptional repressor [Leptospira levettii]TGM26187.1 transcriptional repressor [Leptospira levettii]TGM89427.1 transcriptional repressor [Leptospira levettii]